MDELSALERAFFGAVGAAHVNAWLAETVRERLAVDVAEIAFRSGRIDAVYGLLLADGRKVVLKVHRAPVDVPGLEAQREALAYLASTGYPAPEPVDGPVTRGRHVVTIETM
jgi:Ser/Thr protein kinase RdoA (MazF antagonist)